MMKTKIIFAMSASGKTTLVKELNSGLSRDAKCAVDFDYTAPKGDNDIPGLKAAHSMAFNAYARYGVKYIFCFPGWIDPSVLDSSLFEVIFLRPDHQAREMIIENRFNRDGVNVNTVGYAERLRQYCSGWDNVIPEWSKYMKVTVVNYSDRFISRRLIES